MKSNMAAEWCEALKNAVEKGGHPWVPPHVHVDGHSVYHEWWKGKRSLTTVVIPDGTVEILLSGADNKSICNIVFERTVISISDTFFAASVFRRLRD